jgi:uncharacterized membrane protein YdjX (TVP38/TMEM64 family)
MHPGERPAHPHARARRRRAWALVAIAVLVLLFVVWPWVPLRAWIAALQDEADALGPWGVVLFSLGYVLCIVALVPGSFLSVMAGLTYGLWGIPISIGGATVGSCIAFIIARHVGRARFAAWLRRHRGVHAVEHAVNEEGWRVVALLRLSPLLPFNVQNYLLGVTRIPFRHYAIATVFGIAPGTAFDVYLGWIGGSGREHSMLEWVMIGIGVAASALLVWLVGRRAKRSLERR